MSRTIVAALCALVVGFTAGRWLGPRDPASPSRPGESLEATLRLDDAFARAEQLARRLGSLDADDIAELRLTLESGAADRDPDAGLLLVRAWAHEDPQAATTWAIARSPVSIRSAAVALATEIHARQDPEAAVRTMRDAVPNASRSPHATLREDALIRGWLGSGKDGVEDYIRDIGVGFERQRALSSYARERIRRGESEPLMAWAESLPAEPRRFKLAAFRQIVSQLAMHDLTLARSWCDEHADQPHGRSMRQLVAARWATRDGRAALEWASHHREDPSSHLAIVDAFRSWYRTDRQEALAFARGLGFDDATTSWFAPAVGIAGAAIAIEDPDEGLRWAQADPDPERRDANVIAILRNWRLRDEPAAVAWLEKASLDDAQRARFEQPTPVRVVP